MATLNGLICVLLLLASLTESSEHDAALGRCTCDLTAAQCDAHCCCDPDCSAENLAALRESFTCLPEGPADRSNVKCYSQSWVHSVNPRTDLWVLADDLSGLLCVEVDNNVVKGRYFTNSAQVSATKIDELMDEQHFIGFPSRLASVMPASSDTRGYVVGDLLTVHRWLTADSSSVEPVKGADGVLDVVESFPLRTPNFLGICSPDAGQSVRFLIDVPPVTCWLSPVNLRDACSTSLNPAKTVAWMLRKIHLTETAKCLDRCIIPDTESSCPLLVLKVNGQAEYSPCSGSEGAARQSNLQEEGDACTCYNAVRSLSYTIKYGYDAAHSALAITAIQVNMTLQDIRSEGCNDTSVEQSTEVRFIPAAASNASNVFARSGKPGYQVGLPLLVATCQTYNDAECEAYDASGLAKATVPGILPDGTCAGKGSSSPERMHTINFGEDAVFGCVLRLTRQQLKLGCIDSASFVDRLKILPFGRLAGLWTAITAYGDGTGGWIDVSASPVTEVLQFDASTASQSSTSTCSGAVVGVDLEVLWSPFGEVNNPQARVVAARQSHRKGSLEYTRQNPNEEQAFEFTFTVTFVRFDASGAEARVPPRPSLPLWLPRDLFYPFGLGGAVKRSSLMPYGIVLLTLSALALSFSDVA